MAQIKMTVETDRADDPARDIIVNTLYFDTDVGAIGGADLEDLANDLAEGWINLNFTPGGYRVRVKAYLNPGGGPTGAPDFVTAYNAAEGNFVHGPREVALCLSYFAGAPTPRRRGRIYVGPIAKADMDDRPSANLRTGIGAIAGLLSGLGGANVQWVQHSTTDNSFNNVSGWWVDDEWDTVRSRGLRATTRTTGTVDG